MMTEWKLNPEADKPPELRKVGGPRGKMLLSNTSSITTIYVVTDQATTAVMPSEEACFTQTATLHWDGAPRWVVVITQEGQTPAVIVAAVKPLQIGDQ